MLTRNTCILLGAIAALVLGCGGEGSGSAPPAGSGAPAASGKPTAAATTMATATATATAKPAEPAKPVEMTEFDLSTADAKWKGWVAKGPSDAKVMQDGVQGARIAAKGPSILDQKPGGDNGYDIAFGWGKDDLKSLKKNLEKGAANPDSKMKLTFTKDEPDLLEYTTEVGTTKSYNFVMHMKVEKTDVTCKNGNMMGAGNEDEHKRLMEGCKTLMKKGK